MTFEFVFGLMHNENKKTQGLNCQIFPSQKPNSILFV